MLQGEAQGSLLLGGDTFKQPGEPWGWVTVGKPFRTRKQQALKFQSRGGKKQIVLDFRGRTNKE